MGYIFDHPSLVELIYDMNKQKPAWDSGLERMAEQAQVIADSTHFSGKGADNIKKYFADVYPQVVSMLATAVYDLDVALSMYNHAFQEIEEDNKNTGDAHYEENEMAAFAEALARHPATAQLIDLNTRTALNKVSDIAVIPYSGTGDYESDLQKMIDKINELNDAIIAMEAQYSGPGIEKVQNSVTAVTEFLRDQLAMKDIAKYSPEAMVKSPSYQKMVKAYNEMYDEIEANDAKIKEAQESRGEMLQALYEKRVEEAKKAKFLATIACVVISAAVTVATGGAAAPLVMAATGFATGALSAGVGSYYDQRIGTPACPGEVSWGRVLTDSAVGGTIGALTSVVGGGISGKFSSVAGKASSKLGQMAIKAVGGGIKKVTNNALTNVVNSGYESLRDGTSFMDNLNDKYGGGGWKGYVSTITGDFVAGGTTTVVSSFMGDATAKLTGGASGDDSYMERILRSGFEGGVTDVTSGIASRYTGTMTKEIIGSVIDGEGVDLAEAHKKATGRALDTEEIITDTISGTVGGAASGAGNLRRERKEQADLEIKKAELEQAKEEMKQAKVKEKNAEEKLKEVAGEADNAEKDLKTANTNLVATKGRQQKAEVDFIEKDTQMDKHQKTVDEGAQEFNGKCKDVSERAKDNGFDGIGKTENKGPEFKNSEHIYSNDEGKEAAGRMKLAYTGDEKKDRQTDYENAEKMFKEQGTWPENAKRVGGNVKVYDDDGNVVQKFTMQHQDDYNVRTGEATMELVDSDAHNATKPHAGSVMQNRAANEAGCTDQTRQEYEQSKAELKDANRELRAAQKQQDQAQNAYDNAVDKYSKAEEGYKEAKAESNDKYANKQNAQSSYDKAQEQVQKSDENRQSNIDKGRGLVKDTKTSVKNTREIGKSTKKEEEPTWVNDPPPRSPLMQMA